MYTNKHAWTNKDGTYREIYYYVCSKARAERGKSCDYTATLKKTDIEPLVIEAIRELIQNQDFAGEIKSRIGKEIDIVNNGWHIYLKDICTYATLSKVS